MSNDASSITPAAKQERFLAAFGPHAAALERFCRAMERDADRAYDLFGETVLRAYERFDQIRDPQALLSWLFTTATRLHRRGRQRGRLFLSREERDALAPTDDLATLLPDRSGSSPEEAVDLRALYDALALLPVGQREAVVLFEINGLTLKEIVAIQGGTIAALKVRIHRGRKRLASLLAVDREMSLSPSAIPSHPLKVMS
jgi:RNA polymerase sigma-70 factor (ECF subfamily)